MLVPRGVDVLGGCGGQRHGRHGNEPIGLAVREADIMKPVALLIASVLVAAGSCGHRHERRRRADEADDRPGRTVGGTARSADHNRIEQIDHIRAGPERADAADGHDDAGVASDRHDGVHGRHAASQPPVAAGRRATLRRRTAPGSTSAPCSPT